MQSLSTDATQPPARFIVTDPAAVRAAACRPRAVRCYRQRVAARVTRWRDPSGPDLFRSSVAAGASAAGADRDGAGEPAARLARRRRARGSSCRRTLAKPGNYPAAGSPGRPACSRAGCTASAHTERVLFTAAIAAMLVAYWSSSYSAARLRPAWVHRGDRRAARDLPAVAAAEPDRRLQLPQLRAHGVRLPPQPVHDDPGARAAQRPDLPAQQLARPAEPLRPAVHASSRSALVAARRGRLVLGDEGRR